MERLTRFPHEEVDLIALTSREMTRERFGLPSHHLWPSEASVQLPSGEILGKCARSVFYRKTGVPILGLTSLKMRWSQELGKAVEKYLASIWVRAGVLESSSVRFQDPEYNLSGELDMVLRGPEDSLYIGEIKTFTGYYAAKEILGSRTTRPTPKPDHLLQTVVYLWQLGDKVTGAKIYYVARDTGAQAEFNIRLEQLNGQTYPVVNGSLDRRITVEGIKARYRFLQESITNNRLPPKDYKYRYTPEEVERYFREGKISKTNYEKFQKGQKQLGAWNCSYCSYLSNCYGPEAQPEVDEE